MQQDKLDLNLIPLDTVNRLQYLYRVIDVIKVVDGDTIDVLLDLGMHIYHTVRLRFNRINTPEIHGPKAKVEREAGLKAKHFVEDILAAALKENRPIFVQTIKDHKGNYGRYLAEIWIYDAAENKFVNLNDLLLVKGLAVPYKNK